MVFKCQEDSFLKDFVTTVKSCEPRKESFKSSLNGASAPINGYEVALEDTILFPEGGGQPSDFGFINENRVHYVERRGAEAFHYVEQPLKVGDSVKLSLDWERRLINMQHHSGQHLITAIFEQEFKLKTMSWYLGEDSAYIELNTPKITQEDIEKAENMCNEMIRENHKVQVKIFPKDTPREVLAEFRDRELPEDHEGDIRVITIEGIDSSLCCGTHVNSLSQLQVITLINVEKSKRKGNCLLYFVIGQRAIKNMHDSLNREIKMTALLKTNPVQHPEFVEKLQQTIKNQSKYLKNALKEFAAVEADRLNKNDCVYYVKHVIGAETDFIFTFFKNLTRDLLVVLSIGGEKGAANFVIQGSQDKASEIGEKICEKLGGKGSWTGQKFQGKVLQIEKRDQIEQIVKSYFT